MLRVTFSKLRLLQNLMTALRTEVMCIFHIQIKVSKLHFNQDQKLIFTRDSRAVKAAVGTNAKKNSLQP